MTSPTPRAVDAGPAVWPRGTPLSAFLQKTGKTKEEIVAKIERSIEFDTNGGCWLWRAGGSNGGYGRLSVGDHDITAHRAAYECWVGRLPADKQIDHLCRVRMCVNPAHLEPVSARENVLRGVAPSAQNSRKTHCLRGHEFTPENTYHELRSNYRHCRECAKDREKRRPVRSPRSSAERPNGHFQGEKA